MKFWLVLALLLIALAVAWPFVAGGGGDFPPTSRYDCSHRPDREGRVICETSLVFGPYTASAYRVFECESTLNPEAEGLYRERGLAQIHLVHMPLIRRLGYTWDDMYRVRPNLEVAYVLSQGGENWAQWSCEWAAVPVNER